LTRSCHGFAYDYQVRTARLLELLLLLQARRAATAAELAETLEVSVRTVYRDITALAAAGVPVYSEPGRNGGVRLLDTFDAE
jgi:predicted DNA-binding transcriptional regulator YafY